MNLQDMVGVVGLIILITTALTIMYGMVIMFSRRRPVLSDDRTQAVVDRLLRRIAVLEKQNVELRIALRIGQHICGSVLSEAQEARANDCKRELLGVPYGGKS